MAEETRLQVLDKGYVELVQVMGSDLSVSNAARASFAKRTDEFTSADAKLVAFLAREGHTSPFRHATMTFEVKAPLMVARQWWKYCVGSDHTMDGWNESSRRYVTQEPEFYEPEPDEWRSAPENRKQGSGGPVPPMLGEKWSRRFMRFNREATANYEEAMADGVAAEQARAFLPAYFMYVNWWWTTSLQSVMHFLAQRLEDDAQKEIQLYAVAIRDLVKPIFPVSTELFVEKKDA